MPLKKLTLFKIVSPFFTIDLVCISCVFVDWNCCGGRSCCSYDLHYVWLVVQEQKVSIIIMFMFICQLRTSVSLYFVSIVPFTRLEAFFPQPMRKLFQLMRNAVGHNKHRKLPLLQSIDLI